MLAICVCLWTSCSDGGSEDPANPTPKPEEVVTPEITISSDILTNGLAFDATQGEKSVSFSTNVDWTLSIASTTGGSTWCKASATNGSKGSANVKFTVDEHTDYDDRSVSVTIKAGTASKTFTITQKCADALLITTNKYDVAQDGATIEVEVKANIDYQVAISETAKSWISEVQSKSRALTTHKHSFTIAASEDTEKREGEITFKSGDKVETVKVYQAGGPIVLLTKNEYTVSDQGETISVDLKSNVEFSVKMPEVDWITEENASRAMSSHTLKYVISPNEGYDSRSAEIVFYDKNSNVTDTLKVIQAQKDAIVISQKNYEVKAEGETIEVKLSANVEYEVTMPETDWISQVTSRALTEHTLYFKVNESTSEDDRSAEIVFKDKNSDLSEKVTITQKGIIVLSLTKDEYTISDAGETISVDLKSNVEYGIQMPEVDWIKQETNSRTSSTETLKFIISANETYDCRSAEIVFYDQNSDVTDTLKVIQAQKDAIVISQKNYEVDAEGETIEVKLCTNVEFDVQIPTDATWITQTTSRALSEKSLFFNISENTTNERRSASITITDKNSQLTETIIISQQTHFVVVTLNEAGTMKSLLGSDYLNIQSLKIVGPINGDDVYYLQKMLGDNNFDGTEWGKLTTLDLSETSIVEGGAWQYTNNDIIGFEMFSYCNNLTSIVLPNGVTSIVYDAFVGCYNLTSITIPDGVTSIGGGVFRNCMSLTSITIPDGVTSIERGVFNGCESLTSITIPDGVTSIGYEAFYGCKSLTSITIPDGVISIEEDAFNGCESLTSITIPDGVKSIGHQAFSGCKSLTSITIPDGVTSIGHQAFYGCESLTSITIPDGVTSIGYHAFYGCKSLTSITIPDGVTSIGSGVFSDCKSLKSITIPDGVTSIENRVFSGCDSLTSITIPDGVTFIRDRAFYGCKSLTSITLPDGVKAIDNEAFYNCESLTSITIPDGVTSIGHQAFYGCKSLKSITIPNGVKSIRHQAFYGCESLASITIPDGVISIGEDAFYGCKSLTSITIPDGVTSIGYHAFYGCWSLTSVYCYAHTPPTFDCSVFAHAKTLYVPFKCRQNYINASWDFYFENIIEMD